MSMDLPNHLSNIKLNNVVSCVFISAKVENLTVLTPTSLEWFILHPAISYVESTGSNNCSTNGMGALGN